MTRSVHADVVDRATLTPREAEVLRYLCEGLMRKEIARAIKRQPSTVSRHVESIAEKLDAHSTAEIVAIAVAKGMAQLSLKTLMFAVLFNCTFGNVDIRIPPRPPQVRTVRTSRSKYY